jgi:hypothetical protein
VLFFGGIDTVLGLQFHLFATTDQGTSSIVQHFDNVAANITFVNFQSLRHFSLLGLRV